MLTLLLVLTVLQEGWAEEEVGEGVVWKFRRFDDLYGSKQSVGLLEVDLAVARLGFAAGEKPLEKTSAIASRTRAVAAVNGGYFGPKGQPQGILKIDGKVLGAATEGRGAVGIDAEGKFHWRRLEAGSEWPEVRDAMGGVPLLLEDGRVPRMEQERAAHLVARHPRTAVGITAKNRLILAVVDGRMPEAAGMTCAELADFLHRQGCVWALNLDGGGSSTMWVRGKPEAGVVSFPCDDRKYDHAGERLVANAVVVLAKDVVVADTGEAVFTGTWARSTGGRGFVGGDFATGEGTAAWKLRIEFDGEYEVFVRMPVVAGAGAVRVRVAGSDVDLHPAAEPAWRAAGRFRFAAGEQELTLSPRGKGPIVADAVRLVQRN